MNWRETSTWGPPTALSAAWVTSVLAMPGMAGRSGAGRAGGTLKRATVWLLWPAAKRVMPARRVGGVGVVHDAAAQVARAGEGDLLANEAVVAGSLFGRRAELLEHCGDHGVVLVEGVAVYVELHEVVQPVSGVLAVVDEVTVVHREGEGVALAPPVAPRTIGLPKASTRL